MTTSYPGAVDNLTNPTPSDTLNSATVPHAAQHANINDAVEAIQSTLGTNPQGTSSTVKDRIVAAEGAIINLNLAIDERVPGESGSNAPTAPLPNGYIWVNTTDNSIKVWNGSAWVDPSNAGSGGGPSWAVASGGTETTITDGGKQYKVHTFTGNGTLTVSKAGQVEVLIVSGGHQYESRGVGGQVVTGLHTLPAGAVPAIVGAPGSNGSYNPSGGSALGSIVANPVSTAGVGILGWGASATAPGTYPGVVSTISGASVEYASSGGRTPQGPGAAGWQATPALAGIVIVRYQI